VKLEAQADGRNKKHAGRRNMRENMREGEQAHREKRKRERGEQN